MPPKAAAPVTTLDPKTTTHNPRRPAKGAKAAAGGGGGGGKGGRDDGTDRDRERERERVLRRAALLLPAHYNESDGARPPRRWPVPAAGKTWTEKLALLQAEERLLGEVPRYGADVEYVARLANVAYYAGLCDAAPAWVCCQKAETWFGQVLEGLVFGFGSDKKGSGGGGGGGGEKRVEKGDTAGSGEVLVAKRLPFHAQIKILEHLSAKYPRDSYGQPYSPAQVGVFSIADEVPGWKAETDDPGIIKLEEQMRALWTDTSKTLDRCGVITPEGKKPSLFVRLTRRYVSESSVRSVETSRYRIWRSLPVLYDDSSNADLMKRALIKFGEIMATETVGFIDHYVRPESVWRSEQDPPEEEAARVLDSIVADKTDVSKLIKPLTKEREKRMTKGPEELRSYACLLMNEAAEKEQEGDKKSPSCEDDVLTPKGTDIVAIPKGTELPDVIYHPKMPHAFPMGDTPSSALALDQIVKADLARGISTTPAPKPKDPNKQLARDWALAVIYSEKHRLKVPKISPDFEALRKYVGGFVPKEFFEKLSSTEKSPTSVTKKRELSETDRREESDKTKKLKSSSFEVIAEQRDKSRKKLMGLRRPTVC